MGLTIKIKAMNKKLIYSLTAILFFVGTTMAAFAGNDKAGNDKSDKKIREKIEAAKNNPENIERAAKADVYTIKKNTKISL